MIRMLNKTNPGEDCWLITLCPGFFSNSRTHGINVAEKRK